MIYYLTIIMYIIIIIEMLERIHERRTGADTVCS